MHRSRTFRLAVLLFVVALGSSFLATPVAWADERVDDVVGDTGDGEPTEPEGSLRDVHRSKDRDRFDSVFFRSLWDFLQSLGIISPWRIGS
jgi:hypothetical protein